MDCPGPQRSSSFPNSRQSHSQARNLRLSLRNKTRPSVPPLAVSLPLIRGWRGGGCCHQLMRDRHYTKGYGSHTTGLCGDVMAALPRGGLRAVGAGFTCLQTLALGLNTGSVSFSHTLDFLTLTPWTLSTSPVSLAGLSISRNRWLFWESSRLTPSSLPCAWQQGLSLFGSLQNRPD